MKKIKRVNIQFHAKMTERDQIRAFNRILDRFYTDEGMEEYIDMGFSLQVGTKSASTFVDPYTWDMLEHFIKETVCHIIEDYELDKYPYYAEMRDRYAADIYEKPHSFTY